MRLDEKVSILKGVGDKMTVTLHSMGIDTIGDLLRHYPVRYESFEDISDIAHSEPGKTVILKGTLASEPTVRRTGRVVMTSVKLQDDTGTIQLVWFRMPYLKNSLHRNDSKIVRGRISRNRNGLMMDQPSVLTEEEYEELKCGMQPQYSVTGRVTQKMMRKLVHQALEIVDLERDSLPREIRAAYGLSEWNYAIRTIHFPEDSTELLYARKRLVFEEFLMFILAVRRMKEKKEMVHNPFDLSGGEWTERLMANLPYALTGAQKRVWDEIQRDLEGDSLMNRLVQGDVGSGKTVLAELALLRAAENGYQAAIMAPTEVLARQHYESFCESFDQWGISANCVLLTGSMTAVQKRKAYQMIESHEADIIVGTHALIQEKVNYDRLALVVTDEQHRFGVNQRESFAGKGEETHVMVMSATPIPRTLAIILYGDMDISVVDELPARRLPIKNCVVDTSYRPKAYTFIRRQVEEGRQVYVICPMVEESDGLEAENVIDYTEHLRAELPEGFVIEYLHGKMKAAEKNRRMEEFAAGKIQILVSTTVVEVGVNVPNATVMMVENAERFGLAQLHQLRGRVGRGIHQSYCIFVDHSGDADKNRRLKILNETNDGFRIASEDLKLRGPGDVFGIRQSGDLEFAIGDIFTDSKILQDASDAAAAILTEDPELTTEKYAPLMDKMKTAQRHNWERMSL